MYYKLSEIEREYIEKIGKITNSDYELEGDMIKVDSLMIALEDLFIEYGHIDEEFEDFKRDVEDNYEPIPKEKMYD